MYELALHLFFCRMYTYEVERRRRGGIEKSDDNNNTQRDNKQAQITWSPTAMGVSARIAKKIK